MTTTAPSRTDAEPEPAILCDDDPQRRLRLHGMLGELGYTVHVPGSAREAIAWIRQVPYDLVLLHVDFGWREAGDASFLDALNAMPIRARRLMCVGLYGKDLATLDRLQAFARSANFVMAEQDLDSFQAILKEAVKDNLIFNRPLWEALRQAGKLWARRATDRR